MKQQLSQFVKAYIACALWSSNDNSTPEGGESFDQHYSINDIDRKSLAKMASDCEIFQKNNVDLLSRSGLDDEQAAHDFWLTRNHHGSGYWDKNLGDIGQQLTDAAHACGTCDLYLGDNGKIFCS